MSVVNNFKRINKDDFDDKDRDFVDRLSFLLTPFLEQVNDALNNNIDFSNLNQQFATFTVTCQSGVPTTQTMIKYTLKTKLKGLMVVGFTNNTDDTSVTSAPAIEYSISSDLITIKKIIGLPDNKKYSLSVILIG